uniref:Integrase catalytic domain-containing protein n=1 Tax=Megaselia scalaris TaxID=36166 RepID=T1GPJ2_MEGSC
MEKNNCQHIPSSPHYSQSNGEAESAVKTAKLLVEKGEDILDALLEYRSTPLSNRFSPAELLMGRKIKASLPTCPRNLETTLSKIVCDKEKELKD